MLHGRQPYAIVAVAAAAPRLAALLLERGDILAAFTEKSDDFARTLAASGTFGFLPGEPSAYTQPLYGWFLGGLYWTLGREWAVVGLAQTAVGVGTALLAVALGRRVASDRAGLFAGLAVALHPYLVWHDVHLNREVLDGFVAAALVLATLWAAQRRSALAAAAVGALAGVAILGNARLTLLPLVLAGWLLWRGLRVVPAAVVLAAAALVVAPWVVRNDVEVGCPAITTDAKALWKANNLATYDTLAGGGWIDDVPDPPGAPPTPEDAARQGRTVDECAQMRLYRRLTTEFWREHPGEKAKLSAQAIGMLWDPRGTRTDEGPGAGGLRETARTWLLPIFVVPLFALAVYGFAVVPRPTAVLFGLLLAYVTLTAVVFAGATRYRAPWDVLLAVLAGAALDRLLRARAAR
ncbi:MAG: glycosyltransferase family 39 protein [Pseudomonadota bacterium]